MSDNHKHFKRFIVSIERELIAIVWRFFQSFDDADDAYQQTLITLWKRYPTIIQHPNPRALALRICINTTLDYYRKKSRQQALKNAVVADTLSEHSYALNTDIDDTLTRQTIMATIEKLPNKQAEVFMMRYVQDLSNKEISIVLNCSEATVRKHIQRAREKLQRLLIHLRD